MSLAPHLHPKTYWEERCELLEESFERLAHILIACGSQQQKNMLDSHMLEWNRLLAEITAKHPAPEQGSGIGGEK